MGYQTHDLCTNRIATYINPSFSDLCSFHHIQGIFKVCTASGKEYLLRAPTDDDRGVWTHSIGAVIRALEGMAQVGLTQPSSGH